VRIGAHTEHYAEPAARLVVIDTADDGYRQRILLLRGRRA